MANKVKARRRKKSLDSEENVRITIVPAGNNLSKIKTRFNSHNTEVFGLIFDRDELDAITRTKRQLSNE